jgi:hypothetical protein
MRLAELGLVVVCLTIGAPSLVGCGGTTGTGGPGDSGSGGGVSAGGQGGAAKGGAGAGGVPGTGGAAGAAGVTGAAGSSGGSAGGSAGAGAVRDCFPACIADLRKACERPSPDGGTCGYGNGAYCYSNGIQETQSPVDGGAVITFTEPDGHTPCYQVFASTTGAGQRYETTTGQVVATVTTVDNVNYMVTCNGTTTTVDTSNPACAMLNEGACKTQNVCP